ncbi:hypothetical protein OEZ86_004687 [Tetradesmus obliquus]|nr:hypothetical protein OEZ86_004687 [Tetradesmus obliquus]
MTCLACSPPAYRVTVNSLSCECSPGYYLLSGSCIPCGKGGYCSGGDISRLSCGTYLTTKSATASTGTACITLPGVAFMTGTSTAAPCPVATYNTGSNQRNCTECPGSLVTELEGSKSVADCSAPAGHFYRGQQAMPCSVGTYKEGINKKTSCKACPVGTTTPSTGATTAAACSVVLAGYQAIFDTERRVIGAAPCLVGTFSAEGSGVCMPCPAGLTTQSTKSISPYACLAPPGVGYYATGLPQDFLNASSPSNNSKPATVTCPIGWFKSGFNTEECKPCGAGLLTDKPGATAEDDCFLPAGWGSKASDSGDLVASKCVFGTYGVAVPRYGLTPSACQPCPEDTTTPDVLGLALNASEREAAAESMLFTSIANCSNLPGYGWANGIASECPAGYYNAGFDLRPCAQCGEGLTTARSGSTNVYNCVALPGWEVMTVGTARPCSAGSWSIGGFGSCIACPSGSTSDPMAASPYDCTTCLPGWGSTAGDAGTGSPQDSNFETCTACEYGFYSPGGTGACVACDDGFTSPALSTDSTDCIPRFSSVQPYSSIAFNTLAGDSSISFAAAAADAASCQAACSSNCHFWVFRTQQTDGSDGCWLKNTTANPSADTYMAYKVAATSDYIVWPANAVADAQLGNSAAIESATIPSKCRDACDAQSACLGYWVSAGSADSWQCRLMAGEYRKGVQSSVRAEPSRINIPPWNNNSFAAAPPAAVAQPALPSPAPAVQGNTLPAPVQTIPAATPSPASPTLIVQVEPAASNSSSPAISDTVKPSAPAANATSPAAINTPPANNNSTSPASVDEPAAGDNSINLSNSYETNAAVPAPDATTNAPTSPAVQQQPGGDNTTVLWAVNPSASNSTAPANTSSALNEQQLEDSTSNTSAAGAQSPSPNAAALASSPEPSVKTAAAHNVPPQKHSAAVDDLRSAAAAIGSSPAPGPAVADLSADNAGSSNADPVARTSADGQETPVENNGLECGHTAAPSEASNEGEEVVTAAAVPNEAGSASTNEANNSAPVHMQSVGQIPVTELVSIPYNTTCMGCR